jgi:endonuclease/exonuclease/phosphatase family metal-dependent hydrolase
MFRVRDGLVRSGLFCKRDAKCSKDAASIRIVNIGVFQHNMTEKRMLVLNTHMDDQGPISRLEGAKQIVGHIKRYVTADRHINVLFSGDLNSETNEEAYGVFGAPDSPVQDLREAVPVAQRYGHNNTFTGFDYQEVKRIDYIFIGKKGKNPGWVARGYGVLENRFDDGVFNSDHRAVVGDVDLAS